MFKKCIFDVKFLQSTFVNSNFLYEITNLNKIKFALMALYGTGNVLDYKNTLFDEYSCVYRTILYR